MVSKEELQDGIDLCKIGEPCPDKMIRLASYYIVMDHLFGETPLQTYDYSAESIPNDRSQTAMQKEPNKKTVESDFLSAARGKDQEKVLDIFGELMENIKVIQPKMYDSVLRRINNL